MYLLYTILTRCVFVIPLRPVSLSIAERKSINRKRIIVFPSEEASSACRSVGHFDFAVCPTHPEPSTHGTVNDSRCSLMGDAVHNAAIVAMYLRQCIVCSAQNDLIRRRSVRNIRQEDSRMLTRANGKLIGLLRRLQLKPMSVRVIRVSLNFDCARCAKQNDSLFQFL